MVGQAQRVGGVAARRAARRGRRTRRREGVGGLAERVQRRPHDRFAGGGIAIEQHAELVAAQAIGAAVARDRGVEVGAQALQQRVAGGVAEGVVVLLEAVEVEERERAAVGAGRVRRRRSSRSRISARRLASPVRPSVSDSWRLACSRRRFSRKSRPPRAPATSSAAVASSAAARCTVVNWPMTSTASAMAAKPAVRGSVRPATSSAVRRGASCQAAAAVSTAPSGPQRVDPRAGDVGAHGRLVAERRVGDDVGELPEAEQQPRAVHAPAVEPEGHDDQREQQDVADRIGEVEGDVDRAALGDARPAPGRPARRRPPRRRGRPPRRRAIAPGGWGAGARAAAAAGPA